MSADGLRIPSTNKVKLSWPAPQVSVWAHYTNISLAREQAKKLNGKTYDGQKLRVSFQASKPGSGREYSRNHFAAGSGIFSIEIHGLSLAGSTDMERFTDNLKRFTNSSSITCEEPGYNKVSEEIRCLLDGLHPLESFDMLQADNTAHKVTALAEFSSSDAAMDAIKRFHDTPQAVLCFARLRVEHIYVFKCTISFRKYSIIKPELVKLQMAHMAVQLDCYDPDTKGVSMDSARIRIHGINPREVERLKVDVDRLIRGERWLIDGEIVWDEFFETEEGEQFLTELNSKDSAFFVERDLRRKTLYVWGNRESRELAKRPIIQQMEAVKASRHILPLGKDMLRGLLTGGLEMLEAEIGLNNILLDVIGLTLTLRGCEDDVRKAHRIIAGLSPTTFRTSNLQDSCPICLCDCLNQVKLPCGHAYCSLCLQYLLRSHGSSSAVTCVSAKQINGLVTRPCGGDIPYHIIHELLSPSEEDTLLEASFFLHIYACPERFRYCPTMDCKTIYRVQGRGMVWQCQNCLTRICPACHVDYHEGVTCAEHMENENSSLRALQKRRREAGVQKCPMCKTELEKRGGSDHTVCVLCGTNVCWVCVKALPAGSAYQHMQEMHGEICI